VIVVIDLGRGELTNQFNPCYFMASRGFDFMRVEGVTKPPLLIKDATHLIVSGGAFESSRLVDVSKSIREYSSTARILGICLGAMAVVIAFSGSLEKAPSNDNVELVTRQSDPLFNAVSEQFQAKCGHRETIHSPGWLLPMCFSSSGEIMGVRHPSLPIYGLQFHPEHVETIGGERMLLNFLSS
jgi:anthranilate/para-aminobenzoate synthase component II